MFSLDISFILEQERCLFGGFPMSSKWTSTASATERVKTLLQYAGVPLEIHVREICANFIKDIGSDEIDASSEQVIYSPVDSEIDYREVDRLISIHQYVD